MEERLTDEPEKLDDMDDPTADPNTMPEVEAEGEVDEDLVGLTPSRLKEELASREAEEEKRKREYEKLLAAARAKREKGDFEEAIGLYRQAMLTAEDDEAEIGLWAAYTREYTSAECFATAKTANLFARASAAVREEVLSRMGAQITALRDEAAEEAAPLRTEVEAGMSARREAFRENDAYWRVRFLIAAGCFVLLLIPVFVCGKLLYSRPDILMPVLLGVFGVLAFAAFLVAALVGHKYYVAHRFVTDNEKLSSTEQGRKLAVLEARLSAFTRALEGPTEDEEQDEDDAEAEGPEAEQETESEEGSEEVPEGKIEASSEEWEDPEA